MEEKENYTIKSICEYIVKHYPDSNLAYNDVEYIAANRGEYDEYLAEKCRDFFYYEKLKWCGCGAPEDALEVVRKYLTVLHNYLKSDKPFEEQYDEKKREFKNVFGVDGVYDSPILLCVAYAIDAAGLTEHGSGIGGAWPTTEGIMFLIVLDMMSPFS